MRYQVLEIVDNYRDISHSASVAWDLQVGVEVDNLKLDSVTWVGAASGRRAATPH